MKRSLRHISLWLVVISLCMTMIPTVYAGNSITCNIEFDGDNVIIKGKLPHAYVTEVTIQILNPGKKADELFSESPLSMMDIFAFQDQKETNSSGEFEFNANLSNGKTGEFTLEIGETGKDNIYKKTFNFYGSEYITGVLSSINNAKKTNDSSLMKSLIEGNYKKMNLESTAYENFVAKGENLDLFYKILTKNIEITSVDDLSSQLEECVALVYLNIETDTAEMAKILESNDSIFALTKSTAYSTYKMNSTIQNAVIGKLIDSDIYSKNVLRAAFEKHSILQAINLLNGWENVKNILETNQIILGISDGIKKCNALKSPEEVYLKMKNETYSELSRIKENFEALIEERQTIENNPVKNGGSGGGGGGAKASYSIDLSNNANTTDVMPFVDLNQYEWAAQSIKSLYKKGIVSGKDKEHFNPGDKITREEFVKLLVLGLNLLDNNAVSDFGDVSDKEWYYVYISSAVKAGIINGISGNEFGVGAVITREDMAVIAYRAAVYKNSGITNEDHKLDFNDADQISSYAKQGIAFMNDKGIILGKGEGIFAPKENSDRAQAAVVLYRLIQALNEVLGGNE